MNYGVQPTGFVRKPLPVILAEIEAALITEFGPGVIQTSQSPLGQINGIFSEYVAILWEGYEATYQSVDVDQAEGLRLEILARLRLLSRASGETDEQFRQAITNYGRARNDIQDLARAIKSISGVTYAQVFINESDTVDANFVPPGAVAVAVMGGDDEDIVTVLRQFIVPGISTVGNVTVSSNIDGFCRSIKIVRPIPVPVTLQVNVRVRNDRLGCPPPSATAIRAALIADLAGDRLLVNGEDVTLFAVRQAIECRYNNVEVLSIKGERDGIDQAVNAPVDIAFIEIASFDPANVTISVTI